MSENPLGRKSAYPSGYAPQVLHPIDRATGREPLGLSGALPFSGVDVWTAYELTWLDNGGRPVVGILTLTFPADSPRLVESKSMKLYLDSFAMTRHDAPASLAAVIEKDLTDATGAPADVKLVHAARSVSGAINELPGYCIDYEEVECSVYDRDPALLQCGGDSVSETLHSHLLRSNCPVTGQPDSGSVLISYHGPRIDAGSLLRYLVSFRQHPGFHETCVEQIFCDLKDHCGTDDLTVYARYNRRGGIDINPFRSNFESLPEGLRLWRQ